MKVKINKDVLKNYIILLMLFMPTVIIKYPLLDKISSLMKNIILFLFLGSYILKKEFFKTNKNYSEGIFYMILYFIVLIFITLINSGDFLYVFTSSIKIIAGCIAIYDLYNKRNNDTFLLNLKNILGLLTILNIISIIVFPNGLYTEAVVENEWHMAVSKWWLFGGKNSMIFFIYPANLLAQYFICNKRKKTLFNYLVIICTVLTPLLAKSSTSFAVMLILSSNLFFNKIFTKMKIKKLVIIFIFIYFAVTVVLLTNTSVGILSFVASLFGKDVTFTGRINAWAEVINYILKKPIIGYGLLSSVQQQHMLGSISFVNCHNTFLEVLFNGGVVLLYFMIVFIKKIIRKIYVSDKSTNILLSFAILGIAIESSFEALNANNLFWYMMFIMLIVSIDSIKNVNVGKEKHYDNEVLEKGYKERKV